MKSGARVLVVVLGLIAAAGVATTALGQTGLRWPVSGKVVVDFIASKGTGINIEAPQGTNVRAAEDGQVIYVGSGVEGYGNLILIRHANGYVTAYAHLNCAAVQKGESVTRGQPVGTVGMTGAVSRPQLHFETRKGATPVDPFALLSGMAEELAGAKIVTDPAVITDIQRRLTDLGYAPGKIDGKVGPATRAAIREFERDRNHRVRGEPTVALLEQLKADPITSSELPPETESAVVEPPLEVVSDGGSMLESACEAAKPEPAAPTPSAPLTVEPAVGVPMPVETVSEGLAADRATGNEDVFEIQRKLAALRLFEGKPDGLFGPATSQAIKAFEQKVGLASSGELTPEIVRLIKGYNAAPADTPVTDALVEQPAVTDPEIVAAIQRGLASLGFLHGQVDGVAGQATEKSIRNFEVYYNYNVTGRITPELVDILVANGAIL